MSRVRKIILVVLALVLLCSSAALVLTYRENARTTAEQLLLAEEMENAREAARAEQQAAAPDDTAQQEDPGEQKPEQPADESPEELVMLRWFNALYEQNNDMCGWLSIDGTEINYPVMWTPDDPQHYLRLSFYGESSIRGTLFADGSCDPFEPSDNIIIYGHNMNNDTMFGTLDSYADKDFWEEHEFIHFDTLYEEREYAVIAAFKTSILRSDDEGFRYYRFFNADSAEEFDQYIDAVTELSLYDTGRGAGYGDELLTLSTCSYHATNGRFVVVAVRIK